MKKDISISKKSSIKIGVPVISESWKNRTPRKLKMVGDSLVFVGSFITILTAALTPPGWVTVASGLATLTGRFIIKCVGEAPA